jgi:hypothetical protein
MRALNKARLLLRSLLRRSEVHRELDEEFRFIWINSSRRTSRRV